MTDLRIAPAGWSFSCDHERLLRADVVARAILGDARGDEVTLQEALLARVPGPLLEFLLELIEGHGERRAGA